MLGKLGNMLISVLQFPRLQALEPATLIPLQLLSPGARVRALGCGLNGVWGIGCVWEMLSLGGRVKALGCEVNGVWGIGCVGGGYKGLILVARWGDHVTSPP